MKITVKAREGLMVRFPRKVLAAPGGVGFLLCEHETVEVDDASSFVRKRIAKGDLEVVDPKATARAHLGNKAEA